MPSQVACSLELNLSDIDIKRELSCSKASTVYEIRLRGKPCVMKLFHDNGDPGYTKKGRDLNRFRCELNAYHNLHEFGVCDRSFVPAFYGHIDRVDPSAFYPRLQHFADDKYQPRAILLDYLPCAERLNCENYSEDLFRYAVEGIKQIHDALVHHHDIYPKNILVVSGTRIYGLSLMLRQLSATWAPEKAYCD